MIKQIADNDDLGSTGDDEIIGDTGKTGEIHSLSIPKRFRKKFAKKINGFDPLTDRLEIDQDLFGVLESGLGLATARGKKRVKKILAKSDDQFLYDEKKGFLYFNENQSEKRFGDGGLMAILKGAPEISIENFTFI